MEMISKDIYEDLQDLLSITDANIMRLSAYINTLQKNVPHFLPQTHEELLVNARELLTRYTSVQSNIKDTSISLKKNTKYDQIELGGFKKQYADQLRILQNYLAGVITAGEWQSPSFAYSEVLQAGGDPALIVPSENDYKRDIHESEREYAHLFVQENVDHSLRLSPFAYPTSSGMSAIATVLNHIRSNILPTDKVVVGRSTYFQNKWQLERLFKEKIIYVDEFATDDIIEVVQIHKPAVIFFDSLCVDRSLAIPNLPILFKKLSNILTSGTVLVLDNTARGVTYQPLVDLPLALHGMQLIVVESLIKYHQFGFDRTNAGIIWAPVGSEKGLKEARMHLGTNISDVSVASLPLPNRNLQNRRMYRIGRNTKMLAQRLAKFAKKDTSPLVSVVHPSLPEYPGYLWTQNLPFQGEFIVLTFAKQHQYLEYYDLFVKKIIQTAKERGVAIAGGTSFGFDTTRIYVTARYATSSTQPFVRISVGTESMGELDSLGAVFESVLQS